MEVPTKFVSEYLNYHWNKLKEVIIKNEYISFNKLKYEKASFFCITLA